MRRMLGALLGLTVALAACDDGGADDVAPTTTRPTTTSTTDPPPATTTSTTEPVPFDIEVRRAAIELLEIRNDVFMHPDVSRVSEYIADTCTCLERERGFIEGFVAEGLRWEEPAVQPEGISLSNDDTDSPAMIVAAIQPPTELVDAEGNGVYAVDEDAHADYRLVLVRLGAGQWRVNYLEASELTAETRAGVVARGLP